ncbi:ATP synthase F1 subunit gamma [Buchnera aphidicola]|uniref:ATP synthase gamma chain n=1 Tax=Buchnera aphidicola (Anoecia oenotherae) TaxID=1241833 RepID=A0A4D6XZW3_9GAMM|nr:ATP synthase F1 subunit gamma [Buchnera aphidicola]QCI19151.1 ATP synthase F1 subunit gamma [Buchnera aphidicola (Anoecia oenotherae)]
MLCTKEIKNKIYSVKNTQKITKAMETISNIKLKKNQLKINSMRPYLNAIQIIIDNLKKGSLEFKHSFLKTRKVENVGIIIISSNKGLCGSLNNNLLKTVINTIKKYEENGINVKLNIFGEKAFYNLNTLFKESVFNFQKIEENLTFSEYKTYYNNFLQEYIDKKIDQILIAYNKYKNTVFYTPTIIQLLPVQQEKKKNETNNWDYIYEPHNKETLNQLLHHYVEIMIYQTILNNLSSEHSARMLAMKTANDNSNNIITNLELEYNKTRQSSITQELIEIISGASTINVD